MSALGDWAAKLAAAAERIDDGLAVAVAREQARDFLAIERVITPKRTGHLMESETVDSVEGGGTHAVALVSPHAIYARFRENGGTITRKLPPPHVLGNPAVGFFGHSVTQKGSHYVERSEAAARGQLTATAEMVLEEFLDF
jgi:hypothetical protein